MSQNENQSKGAIVNAKRVRREEDMKGRDKVVLTFGPDKEGRDGAKALVEALTALEGKQVNLDIRIETKTSQYGKQFDSAFVLVKEMVPKDQATTTTFVPKKEQAKTNLKSRAKDIAKALE